MPRKVREPLQVYLDQDERRLLDRMAEEEDLSRAEVLRRGLRAYAAEVGANTSPMLAFADSLTDADDECRPDGAMDDQLVEAYRDRHDGSTR